MIHFLQSSLPSFKSLVFRRGLNVLLAEKSAGASDRQSRNGAGKSSFVELVHFLAGAEVKKDSFLRHASLVDQTFAIGLDVAGTRVTAERSAKKASRVLLDGHFEGWPLQPLAKSNGTTELTNEQWKGDLGALWFGLPVASEESYPSFRSLFSYFARRQSSGGFAHPTQHAEMQQNWDQQSSIAYLLGLDWTLSFRFHELHKQEKIAKDLRQAAKSGDLGRFFGRAGDLRTRLTIAESRASRMREQLDSFQVVPQYRDLEREATSITRLIESLNVENVLDADLSAQLLESIEGEASAENSNVRELYAEAGVVLPELVKRRFDEVQSFHQRILENRKSHLSSEIEATGQRIASRNVTILKEDSRRQEIMRVLQSGGALEHYTGLREELGRISAEVEALRQKLQTAETIESTKTEIDIERATLQKAARDDIHERADIVKEAILTFEQLSESLYERAGSLTIAESSSGPTFQVHIGGQRSKGITNMQLFCFDMMMMSICQKRGRGPGFLIHDSHIFDGVDERQVAKALQLGAQQADTLGFQYIVTMNSDALPKDGFKDKFDVRAHLIDPMLTDATEDGGLFGTRFE